MLIDPMIIPAMAYGLPVTLSGVFLICDSAVIPIITAAMPGSGPKHQSPKTMPTMDVIMEASANPWLGRLIAYG